MDASRIEGSFAPTRDGKCAVAAGGMVATAFPDATRAGVEMLRRGGNAVDAACAAALALGVCEPQASGLGGQTMALIHLDGRTLTLDGSGRAPSRIKPGTIDPDQLKTGYLASTIPTTPAVLGRMQRRYGRLAWGDVVGPAIDIARNGYAITPLQHFLQGRELPLFQNIPSRSGARYFLKNGSTPYGEGDLFRQPELAELLTLIQSGGPEVFYTGSPAKTIDEDMRANGGFLRADDLADIPWPMERPAISGRYRGLDVLTMPPPTPGRILLMLLRLLESRPPEFLTSGSVESIRFWAEAIKTVLLERRENTVRAEFYVSSRDMAIDPSTLFLNEEMGPGLDVPSPLGGETTHLSVMDAKGNAAAITQSVNMVYGSKSAAQGLGFIYNNYLLDSNLTDPSHPHYLKPGSIPYSYVSPTLIMHDRRPWLLVGSPGSERIVSAVAQFISNVVDHGLPISEAMIRPRFHCSLQNKISIEADRFPGSIVAGLESAGYTIGRRKPYSFFLGAIHAVLACRTRKGFQGVAEIRRDGLAAGI